MTQEENSQEQQPHPDPLRTCGLWVVNIQTGEMAAFLRFAEGVQEIFSVQILPKRYPEMLEWGTSC